MNILVVGDTFMPTRYFAERFGSLEVEHAVSYLQIDPDRSFDPVTPSELRLREYQGSPAEIAEHATETEVLVVQGAPVTDGVLDAAPRLKLVCCARGGPVNVDVDALAAREISLITTPGKNAEAVADQTLAFLVMLARGFPKAQGFLQAGNQVADNWEGSKFVGHDLRGHALGLVGYGRVGQRVAHRAIAFGMDVLVYDPYLDFGSAGPGVEQADSLEELLGRSDFVSLHARATAENANLIDAAAFAAMRPGAFLVNTAREALVDEDALDDALASGRLAGAALDVFQPAPPGLHPLLRHENVILTPHIGGATHETFWQAAEMIAEEITRLATGLPLVNVFFHQPAPA
jgi:D-3-phosphoglycerate dehydrogenase